MCRFRSFSLLSQIIIGEDTHFDFTLIKLWVKYNAKINLYEFFFNVFMLGDKPLHSYSTHVDSSRLFLN